MIITLCITSVLFSSIHKSRERSRPLLFWNGILTFLRLEVSIPSFFSYFLSVLLISCPKISFLLFLVFQTLISCFSSKVQVLGFLEKLEMRVCNRHKKKPDTTRSNCKMKKWKLPGTKMIECLLFSVRNISEAESKLVKSYWS